MMREFFIDAFRFEIVQLDQDDTGSTLHEISTRIDNGTRHIVVEDIRTLKQYRALKCFFGCIVIQVGESSNIKIKPDYNIEKPGNGGEIYKIVSDFM